VYILYIYLENIFNNTVQNPSTLVQSSEIAQDNPEYTLPWHHDLCIASDPVYTVPDEFGTGLKFFCFGLPFTREPRNRTNLRSPNRTNSRVNRRKRTNFSPVPNSSGIPRVNGVSVDRALYRGSAGL
jgi:hypothetical protein